MFKQDTATTPFEPGQSQAPSAPNHRQPEFHSDTKMIYLSPAPSRAAESAPANSESRPATGHFDLQQAIVFSTRQVAMLEQIRGILQNLSALAQKRLGLAQEEIATVRSDYQSLAARFKALSVEQFNQVKLFSGETLAVELDARGNKLVMAGIRLDGEPYAAVWQSSVDDPPRARQANRIVEFALQQLARDGTIVRANVERLNFCLLQAVAITNPVNHRTASPPACLSDPLLDENWSSPSAGDSAGSVPLRQVALG